MSRRTFYHHDLRNSPSICPEKTKKTPDEKTQSKHKTIKEYESWIAENILSKQYPLP